MHSNSEYLWHEIKPVAEKMLYELNGHNYYVWDTPAELSWAEKAWYALRQSGLTTYSNGSDKMLVKTQILTLAAMFCKFTSFYFNKPVLIDHSEWFTDLDVDVFLLENALGKPLRQEYREKEICREIIFEQEHEIEERIDCEVYAIYSDEDDDPELASATVKELISVQRQEVFNALVVTFGGKELLHHSLLRTQELDDCRRWIEEGMPLGDYAKKLI